MRRRKHKAGRPLPRWRRALRAVLPAAALGAALYLFVVETEVKPRLEELARQDVFNDKLRRLIGESGR